MTSSLQITFDRWLRRLAFGWRYGNFAARATAAAGILLLGALISAAWQGAGAYRQSAPLSARLADLQSNRAEVAAANQATEPADAIQSLPSAPEVAQIMQTLQQASDKEGAQVMSLQAEDHAPTASALGHLDLTVAINAPYPATLVVIQQVLHRYLGATLRQIQISHVESPTAVAQVVAAPPMDRASGQAPLSVSEAQVTFGFWRRPLNVESASAPAPETQMLEAPFGGTAASAIAPANTAARTAAVASTSESGTTALPPIGRAASKPK